MCSSLTSECHVCAIATFSDFLNDDGSRRFLEVATEMEEVSLMFKYLLPSAEHIMTIISGFNALLKIFPTYDLGGHRITTVSSHYRMLTSGCTDTFTPPECSGVCSGCDWTTVALCEGRWMKCKANSEGITFPFCE